MFKTLQKDKAIEGISLETKQKVFYTSKNDFDKIIENDLFFEEKIEEDKNQIFTIVDVELEKKQEKRRIFKIKSAGEIVKVEINDIEFEKNLNDKKISFQIGDRLICDLDIYKKEFEDGEFKIIRRCAKNCKIEHEEDIF